MLQEKMKILKPVPKQDEQSKQDEFEDKLNGKLAKLKKLPENQKKYSEFKKTRNQSVKKLEPEMASRFHEVMKKQLIFHSRIAELAKINNAKKIKKMLEEVSDDSEESEEDFYSDSD